MKNKILVALCILILFTITTGCKKKNVDVIENIEDNNSTFSVNNTIENKTQEKKTISDEEISTVYNDGLDEALMELDLIE